MDRSRWLWTVMIAGGLACGDDAGADGEDSSRTSGASAESSDDVDSGPTSTTNTSTTGDMGEEPCGTYMPGPAFAVCTATYLAGSGADNAGGVAIAADGTVMWGGTAIGSDLGVSPTTLLGGTDGALVRLSSDGRELLSLTRIGGTVGDVASLSTGEIAVTGDFGVAVLDAEGSQVVWQAELDAPGVRIDTGDDGHVVVLADKRASVFDATGQVVAGIDVSGSSVADVAIDGDSATVYATGFKQDDGYTCTQLQIPFLRAYGYDGQTKWVAYDWTKEEAGDADECADSRGLAVAMGGDGKLYYAGESHGGNTVHRRMPGDLSADAPLHKFDEYNDPYNLNGAAPITFYARFDPVSGAIEDGQFILTRLSSGKGNAARAQDIAADPQGNVFVVGGSACCIQDGIDRTVNGEPAMPEAYQGGGFLLVVSSDFQQRLSWTTFRGTTGDGESVARVATNAGNVALAVRQQVETETTTTPLLTFNAAVPDPGGGPSDGHLVVFAGP